MAAARQSELVHKRKDSIKKAANKIPFENAYAPDCYKFIVTPGNNSQMIRKAMQRRNWWIEIQQVHSMFNFKWQPTSGGLNFNRLGNQSRVEHNPNSSFGSSTQNMVAAPIVGENSHKQLVNHLEFHQLLSEKFNLLQVMQKHCEQTKENTFDFMPITFYVEVQDPSKE